jgi:pSer/pThr/pTyr-binding forkhead associated (FHA) protein
MYAPHGMTIHDVKQFAQLPDAAFETQCGKAMLMVRGSSAPSRIDQSMNTMPGASGDLPTGDTVITLIPLVKSDRNTFNFISVGRTGNNDVVLIDTTLSKFHAFFREENGVITLMDAGSRNGTTVDGVAVPVRGNGDPVVLNQISEIRFGSVAASFMPLAKVRRFVGL